MDNMSARELQMDIESKLVGLQWDLSVMEKAIISIRTDLSNLVRELERINGN